MTRMYNAPQRRRSISVPRLIEDLNRAKVNFDPDILLLFKDFGGTADLWEKLEGVRVFYSKKWSILPGAGLSGVVGYNVLRSLLPQVGAVGGLVGSMLLSSLTVGRLSKVCTQLAHEELREKLDLLYKIHSKNSRNTREWLSAIVSDLRGDVVKGYPPMRLSTPLEGYDKLIERLPRITSGVLRMYRSTAMELMDKIRMNARSVRNSKRYLDVLADEIRFLDFLVENADAVTVIIASARGPRFVKAKSAYLSRFGL